MVFPTFFVCFFYQLETALKSMRIFPSLCSNLCWQINQLFDGDGYKVKVPQDTLALNKCASVRRAAILLFHQLAF